MHPQTDYPTALAQEIGQDKVVLRGDGPALKVLVAGCRSGQRAISLARFFDNVEVTAIDRNLDNITFANGAAAQLNLSNLQFQWLPLQKAGQLHDRFDVIECGPALGNPVELAETIQSLIQLLSPLGVIRFTLPRRAGRRELEETRERLKSHDISATPDNVRAVRQILLEEAQQGLWQDVIRLKDFYTLPGTRDLLFAEDEPSFNLQEVSTLLKATGLEFLGFVDLAPADRQRVRALNPKDLTAWHMLDQSQQTVFRDTYEIYCRRIQE
jgi:SAM-dependent methyltransferase